MTDLPQGVTEDMLYEQPPKVVRMPTAPVQASSHVQAPKFAMAPPDPRAQILSTAMDVLSARLLALIAVVAACALWGYAVYDPLPLRSIAAAGFSVLTLAPVIYLHLRHG